MSAEGAVVQGFLLDENLSPKLRAGFGEGIRVAHARDLGPNPSDLEPWSYAERESLVIVTKAADFIDRILARDVPPPWVVQVRCGNLRARALREFLEQRWPQVVALLPEHRLILLSWDRIEALT